jgi:Uma2 family endonuclease
MLGEPLRIGDRVNVRLTYEDYAALPNDGRRYQLLEGEIDVTPAPSTTHQRVSRNLELVLSEHVRRLKLGALYDAPVDMILDEETVTQPDILFVSRERLSIVHERGIEGPADLVVEILSPKTRRVDRTTKMRIYAHAGVRHYWLVDPEARTLETFALSDLAYVLLAAANNEEILKPDLFPGLEIRLGDIFAAD